MGNFLLAMKSKLSHEQKWAFISAFVLALLVHLYKFTNTLPNHDSLYNYYSDQNIVGSGRWALSFFCSISTFFDLPWIIGLFSCLYIGLTALILVSLFRIKNPIVIALCGGLLAAAPGTTETFFFTFTADGYMAAMLLAASAVWLSRIEVKFGWQLALSGVCVCVACGIYQAYVSFALLTALCYFIYELLENRHDKKLYFRWVLRQIIIYIAALAAYYIIWKLCLYIGDTAVNDYQGIAQVGSVSPSLFVSGLVCAIRSTALYFLQWNIQEHGFTLYNVLNLLFAGVFVLGLSIAIGKSGIGKRTWALGLLVLCLVAIVPFACIWHFVSEGVSYRPMMLQCFILPYLLTALLFERWGHILLKNLTGAFLALMILNNALMANVSYFYMNLCYERTYADGLEMAIRIHQLQDDYAFDTLAVIGERHVEVMWESNSLGNSMPVDTRSFHMLIMQLEENLMFSPQQVRCFLNATYGLDLALLSPAQAEALAQDPFVRKMSCWPSGDSMQVIDGVLILKLSDS